MATAAEIRNMAALRLGATGEGETLESPLTNDFDQSYKETYGKLAALNIAVWDFDEEIPDEYVYDVVNLTALWRISDYRIPDNRAKRIIAMTGINGELAYGNIKELKGGDTYITPTPDYF